jgi:translation initiation factor IF-3
LAKRQKKQPIRKTTLRFRVNDQIRLPDIRLVGDNLQQLSETIGQNIEAGIYPTRRVLEWADRMELDLVEISPNAKPPVCQIIDYKKFLYMRKKKEKEIKSNAVKTVVKEIRFGPNISEHDFDFKLKHAINFLKEGSKVKSYVHFRGRTIVFRDRGELVLLRFIKELAEHGAPEALPKMEGRRMIVVIAPKKSALKKPVRKKNKHERRKEEEGKVAAEAELQRKLNEEEE